jgi:hypothetical protein
MFNFLLLLLESLLELHHLLIVLDLYYLFHNIANDSFFLIQGLNITSLIQKSKLLLQLCNFILIFSQ